MVGERPKRTKPWIWAVVVALVAAYFLIGAWNSTRECNRRPTCKNNLKQIGLALHMYATDHDESFPTGERAAEVLGELMEGGYLKDGPTSEYEAYPVYVCPSARDNVKAWRRSGKLTEETCSYEWVAGLRAASRPDFALAFDKAGNHHGEGRNVLYVDGHVGWNTEEGFQERLAWQREMMERMVGGGEFVRFEDWKDARGEE